MAVVAFVVTAVLAATLLSSGCSTTDGKSADESVTLSLWHVYGSQTESPLNDLVAEFNETVGAEQGIVVAVTSVSDSDAIDEALIAAAGNEPGSAALPDLFTAYPRVVESVGIDRLLAWDDYLSDGELDQYVDSFLEEGYFGDDLLMLPIAKSTEMMFLNETLFERFVAATDARTSDLARFELLFPLCEKYAAWSGGGSLLQINDFYHYFIVEAAARGESFAIDGGLSVDSPWFAEVWMPLARAGISGGLCVADGYASDRWKTGEVLCNVGSTAGVLYLRDYVTYEDGSTEDIQTAVLPYPTVGDGAQVTMQRGGGLFAVASDDERKNEAAVAFARWITLQEANTSFTLAAGYLPVTEGALAGIGTRAEELEDARYRMLYEVAGSDYVDYEFCSAPLFDGAGQVQDEFEEAVKSVLDRAHDDYEVRVAAGEDPDRALADLAAASLMDLRAVL